MYLTILTSLKGDFSYYLAIVSVQCFLLRWTWKSLVDLMLTLPTTSTNYRYAPVNLTSAEHHWSALSKPWQLPIAADLLCKKQWEWVWFYVCFNVVELLANKEGVHVLNTRSIYLFLWICYVGYAWFKNGLQYIWPCRFHSVNDPSLN